MSNTTGIFSSPYINAANPEIHASDSSSKTTNTSSSVVSGRSITLQDLHERASHLETDIKTAHQKKINYTISTIAIAALALVAAAAIVALVIAVPTFAIAAPLLFACLPIVTIIAGAILCKKGMDYERQEKYLIHQSKHLGDPRNKFASWACMHDNPKRLEHIEFYQLYQYENELEKLLKDSSAHNDAEISRIRKLVADLNNTLNTKLVENP